MDLWIACRNNSLELAEHSGSFRHDWDARNDQVESVSHIPAISDRNKSPKVSLGYLCRQIVSLFLLL